MRDGSQEDIADFLNTSRLAFVGVSRDSKHFSRALFREFIAQGYDPIPVNPQATEIEGRGCFTHVFNIPPPVEAALIMTGTPDATTQAIRECNQADIRKLWIYKAVSKGESHEQTVELCRLHGSAVIEGYCPFMFLPNPKFFHRVHRVLMKVAGSYPL
jgi:predicted CoA-binding protein